MRIEPDVWTSDTKPAMDQWAPGSTAPDGLVATSVFDHDGRLLGRVFHEDSVYASLWRVKREGRTTDCGSFDEAIQSLGGGQDG